MYEQQVSYRFPPDLIASLRATSKRTGVPASEIVRRALNSYLDKQKDGK